MDRWMDGKQDVIDKWVDMDTSSNIYFEKGGFTIRDNCTIERKAFSHFKPLRYMMPAF